MRKVDIGWQREVVIMEKRSGERRKHARLDLALSVSYTIIGKAANIYADPREALSEDVSMGGLRLMTPSSIENGTMLELEIIIGEDSGPISAEGEVVWQNKISDTSFETGVMIKSMLSTDKRRFMEFVFDQMSKITA